MTGRGQGRTAGLHADQLQLDAPDGGVRVLHHQLARQRLGDGAVGGVEVASDEKFGQQCSLKERKTHTSGWEEKTAVT